MSYKLLSKYRSELMGVAMLLLLFFHAFELQIDWPLLKKLQSACFCGVDIFIFLSAVGLSMSLSAKKRTYPQYLLRRAGRILPAYYLVTIPFFVYQILFCGAHWSSLLWNSLFLAYWIDPASAFNWYVTGILLFYALAPWWHRLLERSHRPLLLTISGALVFILGYMLLIRLGVWSYLDIIYRVPIFLLGLLIGLYITGGKKPGQAGIAVGALMSALGVLLLLFSARLPFYMPLCLAFFLLIPPFCLLLAFIFERLRLKPLYAFLRFIGESSLEIYLINVVFVVKVGFFHKHLPFGPTNRLFYLVLFSANVLLGVLLHKVIEKARKYFHARPEKYRS